MKFKKNQIIKTNKVRVPRAYVSWLNNQVIRIICLCLKLNPSIKELRQSGWSWRSGNWEETGIETKRTFWTIEVGLTSNHSWDHSRQTSYMAKNSETAQSRRVYQNGGNVQQSSILASTGEMTTSSRYCLIPSKTQWDLVVNSKNYKVHFDSDLEEQTQRSC
jgi:hypothetical protein